MNTLFVMSDGCVPTAVPETLRPYAPHRVVNDYTVPGVNFWFLSERNGRKRFAFEATRTSTRFVTPHNHKGTLDFRILQGTLKHTTYVPNTRELPKEEDSDKWYLSRIRNSPEGVTRLRVAPSLMWYKPLVAELQEGDDFIVPWWQIHSVEYAKGCIAMFEAYPDEQETVLILEPVGADGRHIVTHTLEPWMFGA
jgi:hypothetical protein